jgi:hypothetical protein
MKRYLILIAIVSICSAASGQIIYWNMPTTADQATYGGVCRMMSESPQGLSINPSYLGFIKYRQVMASGMQWWQEVYGSSASASLPFKGWGTFSVSIGYWSLGSMTGYTEDGIPQGTIQSQATNLGLGYGLALYDSWGIGISIKATRYNQPERYDWGWASDLAIAYKRNNLTGSIMIQDLGPEYPKNSDIQYPLNTEYVAGLKADYFDGLISGILQYSIPKEGDTYPGVGLEINPLPSLAVKLGYEDLPEYDERSPLGVGIEIKKLGRRDMSVSYGYRSYGNLGKIQAVSMGISF